MSTGVVEPHTSKLPEQVGGERWRVLAAGTFALWCYSLLYLGIAVISPGIRARFHVGLADVGIDLAAVSSGASASLLLWEMLADRLGERLVMTTGLTFASGALAGAAMAKGFASFTALLFAAGLFGASANAASARAVMGWFGVEERGLALGIRQTAITLGGLAAAIVLPHLRFTVAIIVLSVASLLGAMITALVVRERAPRRSSRGEPRAAPDRRSRRRIGLISAASILLSTPQVCLVGFVVLFLHDARGLSVAAAGGVFGAIQVIGTTARIGAGWWSDRLGARVGLIRMATVAISASVALTAALTRAPLVLLLPAVIIAGGLALGWNALAVAVLVESVDVRRSGTALGFQQTGLALWSTGAAPAFAFLVERLSWRDGFLIVALIVACAYPLMRRLGATTVAY